MKLVPACEDFEIRIAQESDVPLILSFIKALADYEHLSQEVIATEAVLRQSLFGQTRYAEVILGYLRAEPVSFAVYFYNFSTFLGQAGLYLEDIYVKPAYRGLGIGRTMFVYLAKLAKERGCGRFEWAVLDWNQSARDFYTGLGAQPLDAWILYRITGDMLSRLADEGGRE
jgi:GNAT superfamily N-acetyltransferase